MARAKKKQKQRRNLIIFGSGTGLLLFALAARYLYTTPMPVLQPAGPIAAGQKQLMITAFLLMLIIVVPVFILAFGFAWRYRESNTKAVYKPNWDHSRIIETIWWLIPTALIVLLAIMTWHGTFKYDPYKSLASSGQKELTVQVVALDWRWLFIYPEQKVASVNELRLPVNTPVKFEITADAPMNSFWIPQLGGQVYAMPGMGTTLHLKADRSGRFYGSSANISGQGFADMHFIAVATSDASFKNWVKDARQQPPLTKAGYDRLAQPQRNRAVITYGQPVDNLYGTIMSKYMNMDHAHMHMEGM
ncbi:MAG: Ubiquinol oxidase subunit 2 [Candidatus Saccharibacteria bacterium]|nr:Ubiquinol oxidase subunit 2 [Candidatus Saccharibacteria bacterium]